MNTKGASRACVVLLFALPTFVLALVASPAIGLSVTFTVNSVADIPAAGALGNGVCETASGNGICTLRAALQKAIAYPGGGVTIVLPAGTYARASTYPHLTVPVTIQGAGVAQTFIDANGLDIGFDIDNGATVSISGLTIQHAAPPGSGTVGRGVLITSGTVTLQDCAIIDGSDGAIFNNGNARATVRNCSLLRNKSSNGGAITNDGTLLLENSVVGYNRSDQGGALELQNTAHTTIVNTTISNNSSGVYGPAVRVTDSTVEVDIFNSTITGNLLDIASTTTPPYGGGIDNTAGGVVHLQNSVLGQNFVGIILRDCAGPVVSLDYNAVQTTASCTITGAVSHNVVGVDPQIGELAANGGPTLTRALLAGSPLINAIPRANCTDSFGAPLTTDQRGQPRPSGSTCSIGAFEGSVTTTVLNNNLIRNGDAEATLGSSTGIFVGVPYWTVTQGQFTATKYGATPSFPRVGTDPVPLDHGASFFSGGQAATSVATQTIDLSAATTNIDTGTVRFVISGDFGGNGNEADAASMTVTFQNASHTAIGDASTVGGSVTNRGGVTGFGDRDYQFGTVPAGARFALATVTMTRATGTFNDGYADNLSLVLTTGPAFADFNQHGLTGSWYNPATSGQGFELEIYPSTDGGFAQMSWFTFDTDAGGADHQRWYTLSAALQSGSLAQLGIYENTGGNFDAGPVTTAQPIGVALLTFDTCTSGLLLYKFIDASHRTGTIPLSRLTQNVTCSLTSARPTNPDFALSGNWYDPATSGQGFGIEINPNSATAFVSWYTYAPSGSGSGISGQRWYTAQGSFTSGLRSIPLQIYETTGGIFDTATTATPTTASVGTATLVFQSCTGATLSYNFSGGSSVGKSRTINLSRLGPTPPGCS